MKRRLMSAVSAAVLTLVVGFAIIAVDHSVAVADSTKTQTNGNNANGNNANANSTKKPGENCDKLGAATQEYKDCIKAQAQIQNNTDNKKKQTTTGN